ncbi:hypothetical protein FGRMN_8371 [Fusarium graminum]|nr:hypothetical protein FGRMN_8371 [Fusarium graminum]
MLVSSGIAVESTLLGLALFVLILRCWVRVYYEKKQLSICELFTAIGWSLALGWFITSTMSMLILKTHPPVGSDNLVHNVDYLKFVFAAEYFFDAGVYWPKFSIIAFYWVIEKQISSAWYSFPNFITQWSLNFSSDLLLFCFPFFILKHLKLRSEQKIGLVGVFSLGAITLAVSLTRFVMSVAAAYQLDYPTGNTLCTAEMTTAIIVVCLPGLKKLIVRSRTPTNTSNRGNSSLQSSSAYSAKATGLKSRTSQAYAEYGVTDDEIGLCCRAQESQTHDHELQTHGLLPPIASSEEPKLRASPV